MNKQEKIIDYTLASLVCILFGVAFLEFIGVPYIRYIIIVLITFLSVVSVKYKSLYLSDVTMLLVLVTVYFFIMLCHQKFIPPNLFLAPVLGYFISRMREDVLYKTFAAFVIIQFSLELYEMFTGKYIYIAKSSFSGLELDEKTYGGAIGIFRAKGLLEGPTTVGAIFIMISFLFRNKFYIILASLAICYMASARLGIIVCFLILCFYFYQMHAYKFTFGAKALFTFFSAILLFALTFSIYNLIESEFLRSAISFNSSQNINRILMWVTGFNHYLEYDTFSLIFGDYGSFRTLYNNSPENAWINLLVEGGAILFLFYFFYTISLFRFDLIVILPILLLISSGMAVTLFASFSSVLLYFLLIFRLKANK